MGGQRFKPVYGIVGTVDPALLCDDGMLPVAPSVLEATKEQALHMMADGSSAIVGIYALGWESLVMYIGQSTDVARRVSQHKSEQKIPFQWWKYLPCERRELDGTERALITKFKPPFNKNHV